MVLYKPIDQTLKKAVIFGSFFMRALKKTKCTQLCKYVHELQTVDKLHSILF